MNNAFHNRKKANSRILKWDFLLLVGILITLNLPYLRKSFVPIHDTYYFLQVFYYMYNSLFLHGELPAWVPYGAYGFSANFIQLCITPANYLVGLLGYCFGIRNALVLFKLSIILEQFIFLLGLYKLCTALFKSRITVFLVCVGALCGTVWYWQLPYNFHFYYLIPFALYSLLVFFKKEKPSYLWAAGIYFILSLIGGPAYWVGLYLFIAVIFSLPLLYYHKKALRSVLSLSAMNLFCFALFVLFAIAYYIMSKDIVASSVIVSPGRDIGSWLVPLRTFLTYGNDRVPPLYGFVVGWPPNYAGNSHYVGLLTLFLAVWAFVKVRNSTSMPFLSVTFILFWFSLGGMFSLVAYFFPGMFLYRHIFSVYAFYKLFILILAGFGFEDLRERLVARFKEGKKLSLKHLGLIFVACVFIIDIAYYGYGANGLSRWPRSILFVMVMIAMVRVTVYLIGIVLIQKFSSNVGNSKSAGMNFLWRPEVILLACFLFDLFSFQAIVHYSAYRHASIDPSWAECFAVHEMPYRERRSDEMSETRQIYAAKIAERPYQMAVYTTNTVFMMAEPPWPRERMDMLSRGVYRLLEARGGIDENGRPNLPLQDPWLYAKMGISKPKIRVVSNVEIVETPEDALKRVREFKDETDPDVLLGNTISPSENGRPSTEVKASTPIVKSFSANEVIVEVEVEGDGDSAWLIYADSYHPGWKAWVNGQEKPIVEANLAFKAVQLSKGGNVVKFRFNNLFHTLFAFLILLSNLLFFIHLPIVFQSKGVENFVRDIED